MASAKIVYKKKPNKDGTYSIILQIIHNRKVYPKTIIRVPADDWDPKKMEVRPRANNSSKYNIIIGDELKYAKEYILDSQLRGTPVDPESFLSSKKHGHDIISHLTARMDTFSNNRTKLKFATCINRINEANLNRSIFDVNGDWIQKFTDKLKAEGNNANTRTKYITTVGTIFKEAKKDGLIVVNPFEGIKRSKSPSKKAKLTLEEFRKFQSARFEGKMEVVRRIFVFATLARGMRGHDVLTLEKSAFKEDRLIYQAQKAGFNQDGKIHDIRLTPAMMECVEGLPANGNYVFPLVKIPKSKFKQDPNTFLRHIESVMAIVNPMLKVIATELGITKNISTHVARHTFAYLSGQANIPLGTIQQLLGHGDITTTKIYVESLQKSEELDDAVEGLF